MCLHDRFGASPFEGLLLGVGFSVEEPGSGRKTYCFHEKCVYYVYIYRYIYRYVHAFLHRHNMYVYIYIYIYMYIYIYIYIDRRVADGGGIKGFFLGIVLRCS